MVIPQPGQALLQGTSLFYLTEYLETSASFTTVFRHIVHHADELPLVTQFHRVNGQNGASDSTLSVMRVTDLDPPGIITALFDDLCLIIKVVDSCPALVLAWQFLYKVKNSDVQISKFIVCLWICLYILLRFLG